MRVLLTPEAGPPKHWTAYAKDMENIPPQSAPTIEEAIAKIKVPLREKIRSYLNRKPPEKPYFPCVVGLLTPGAKVMTILVKMDE